MNQHRPEAPHRNDESHAPGILATALRLRLVFDSVGIGYVRGTGEYVRPAVPLRLDGTLSLRAKTGFENTHILKDAPAGAEHSLEVVPEPGNPHDHNALALDIGGNRVGYVPAKVAERLSPAVVEANTLGLRVMMQGRTYDNGEWRELEIRCSDGPDLRAWLCASPADRKIGFFEFDWFKPGRQFAFQSGIRSAIGNASESELLPCDFVYGAVDFRGQPCANVMINGIRVADVRPLAKSVDSSGLARFHRWPDNIEIKVLIPDINGQWPRSSAVFSWKH